MSRYPLDLATPIGLRDEYHFEESQQQQHQPESHVQVDRSESENAQPHEMTATASSSSQNDQSGGTAVNTPERELSPALSDRSITPIRGEGSEEKGKGKRSDFDRSEEGHEEEDKDKWTYAKQLKVCALYILGGERSLGLTDSGRSGNAQITRIDSPSIP